MGIRDRLVDPLRTQHFGDTGGAKMKRHHGVMGPLLTVTVIGALMPLTPPA
jgi:hypothetical protein